MMYIYLRVGTHSCFWEDSNFENAGSKVVVTATVRIDRRVIKL